MTSDTRSGEAFPPAVETRTAAIAVVIITYNSADVLPGLLDSLDGGLAGLDRRHVFVVDNDSHDRSVEIARAHAIRPTVIRMGRNAGYAAGINAAAARIKPDCDLLVLNPDIRLTPGAVARLKAGFGKLGVGATVPQMLDEQGGVTRSLRREPSLQTAWSDALFGSKLAARMGAGEIVDEPSLYQCGGEAEWATGAIVLISAAARSAVGAWDESFFLYSEEVDYFDRMRRLGYSVALVAEAKAVHIGGEYHRDPWLSALMTVNRIRYYGQRHGRIATALFRLSIIVGETMRAALGPGHRAALGAALSPSTVSVTPAARTVAPGSPGR